MTAPLTILMVHNAYQHRGGEDSVVDSEVALLRSFGHEVIEYRRHNDDIKGASKAKVAMQTLWSTQSASEVAALIGRHRPDVMHVHNTLPLVSASVYWAAHKRQVPVVQTLHNFRLLCPQAMFLRDGRVCEDCLGKLPLPGVLRACYRQSTLQTAVLAASVVGHKVIGTFDRTIGVYLALSEFARRKFIQGGLPADKIRVKPNFVDDTVNGGGQDLTVPRQGGLFVGRLSPEKGIEVLLQALRLDRVNMQVLGSGDWAPQVRDVLRDDALGFAPVDEILRKMSHAAYLVVPSICYESFPRTIVEAYSVGLPVIASRMGSMAELVQDGETGLLFNPGDAVDLAAKMRWAQDHPQEMARMGVAARARYLSAYRPDQNHALLMQAYADARKAVLEGARIRS